MRFLFAALLLCAASFSVWGQTTDAPFATNTSSTVTAPVSDVIPDGEIAERAQSFLDQNPVPASEPDATATEIRESMVTVEPQLQLLSDEATRQIAETLSLEHITSLERWGVALSATIGSKSGSSEGWVQLIGKRLHELKTKLDDLSKERLTWTDTAAAQKTGSSSSPKKIPAVLARIDALRQAFTAQQLEIQKLQTKVSGDSELLKGILSQLDTARVYAISKLFQFNVPPVWSMEPLPEESQVTTLSWSRQFQTLASYFDAHPARFLLHVLLLFILAGVFWWLRGYARDLAKAEPTIAPAARIFDVPIATALLLALGASPLIYYPIAPRLLSAGLGAVALIPCVLVLRQLIEKRLFPILYALVAFYFLEEFRSVAVYPIAGARAFLLGEILCAVAFLGWLLLALRQSETVERFSRNVQRGARAALAVLAAGWLAEILGFTLLANLICVAVQRAATLALALYAGIRIIEALLFIGMRLRPLSNLGMVREHRSALLRRAERFLIWTAVTIWLLTIFEQFPWAADVNRHVFNFFARYDHNNLVLRSPGRIALALLIAWGAFQFSRFVRFTLETDFYPRFRLAAGIPYAISNLLHYVLLTIAFIAVTSVLGVDMTKFTILVSALGVGVGFGLQNIINNFVSGLILLFERPVKIGDTIQTGTDTGTVERIGIRASVLRTPTGTEVIVPNGTLISNNVTNWTFSSRERIILIPLNVPRGTDTTHLAGILTAATATHPKVLKHPAPQVVAQTLGANLGLELRAWTAATDDWTTVRSEIVLALNSALSKENITIA